MENGGPYIQIHVYPRDVLYPRQLTNQNASLLCKFLALSSFDIAELRVKVMYRVDGFKEEVAPPLHPRDLC